jgi:hypothetical protein
MTAVLSGIVRQQIPAVSLSSTIVNLILKLLFRRAFEIFSLYFLTK